MASQKLTGVFPVFQTPVLAGGDESIDAPTLQREIEWWLANRPADKIFVLLTEGAIAWDERARDFDWAVTTALPDLVRGKFQSEPLYVDLTWANHQDQLDLQNARFRQAILDIAAPLHGEPRDALGGRAASRDRSALRPEPHSGYAGVQSGRPPPDVERRRQDPAL
jgi:hypothetical protein